MNLDSTAKRAFPFVVGAMIATAAYYQASGISHVLGYTMIEDIKAPPPKPAPVSARRPPPDTDHATSAAAILERNPFDSVTGPLKPPPSAAADGSAAARSGSLRDDPPCDAGRVLLILRSEDPSWSVVSIEGPDGDRRLYRRGGEVAGRKIALIGWDRVWLTSGGARCQLVIGSNANKPKKEGAPAASTGQPQAGGPPKDAVPPEIASRIRKVNDREFVVDRSAIDAIIEQQQTLLMRSVMIMPERNGDQVTGLKLRVRPGSVVDMLGLKSGDTLHGINGFDLADPQKALEAYQRLRTAPRIQMTIDRDGRPMTIDYSIR